MYLVLCITVRTCTYTYLHTCTCTYVQACCVHVHVGVCKFTHVYDSCQKLFPKLTYTNIYPYNLVPLYPLTCNTCTVRRQGYLMRPFFLGHPVKISHSPQWQIFPPFLWMWVSDRWKETEFYSDWQKSEAELVKNVFWHLTKILHLNKKKQGMILRSYQDLILFSICDAVI